MHPAERKLWRAFYVLEPFGHEVEYAAKNVAASLNRLREWKDFRPVECLIYDNPFTGQNLQAARQQVASTFAAFAEMAKAGLVSNVKYVVPQKP